MSESKSRIKEMSDRIIRMALARVPKRYTNSYGRWVWVSGFLAAWLARIAIMDVTVRQQLRDYEEDTENSDRD